MKKVTALTNDPIQNVTLVLEDGTRLGATFNYWPNQQGWFYSLNYGDFAVNNRRLVTSPNLLRAFRNIIPFGLCCTVIDGYEPIFQDDFVNGRASLYVLSSSDILETENLITLTLPALAGYSRN